MIVHGSFMEKSRHTWWVMVSFPQDGVLFLTYSLLVSQGRPSVFDHFEPLMFKFWRHHETPMFHDAILGFSMILLAKSRASQRRLWLVQKHGMTLQISKQPKCRKPHDDFAIFCQPKNIMGSLLVFSPFSPPPRTFRWRHTLRTVADLALSSPGERQWFDRFGRGAQGQELGRRVTLRGAGGGTARCGWLVDGWLVDDG